MSETKYPLTALWLRAELAESTRDHRTELTLRRAIASVRSVRMEKGVPL